MVKEKYSELCWYPPAPQRGVEVLPVGGVAQLRPLLLQELDLLPESKRENGKFEESPRLQCV